MAEIVIKVDGWEGDPKIEEYAACETQKLIERGATVDEAILIITNVYEYTTFYYQYEPGDRIKIYKIKFCYKDHYVDVVLHGANVHWTNTIRSSINECLRRMSELDRLPLKHAV